VLFPSTQRYRKVNNYTRVIINTPPYSTLLEELGMALAMSEGVLKITGQPGCGKTAVCQQLREQLLSQHTPVVFFADAPESAEILQNTILTELKLPADRYFTRTLTGYLQQAPAPLPLVVIIDNAQKMDYLTFSAVRMLGNIQDHSKALVRILLCGSDQLNQKLSQPAYRSLAQHISFNAVLQHMDEAQALTFVQILWRKRHGEQLPPEHADVTHWYLQSQGKPGALTELVMAITPELSNATHIPPPVFSATQTPDGSPAAYSAEPGLIPADQTGQPLTVPNESEAAVELPVSADIEVTGLVAATQPRADTPTLTIPDPVPESAESATVAPSTTADAESSNQSSTANVPPEAALLPLPAYLWTTARPRVVMSMVPAVILLATIVWYQTRPDTSTPAIPAAISLVSTERLAVPESAADIQLNVTAQTNQDLVASPAPLVFAEQTDNEVMGASLLPAERTPDNAINPDFAAVEALVNDSKGSDELNASVATMEADASVGLTSTDTGTDLSISQPPGADLPDQPLLAENVTADSQSALAQNPEQSSVVVSVAETATDLSLTTPSPGEEQAVVAVLKAWIKVWMQRDVGGYFGYYATQFQPSYADTVAEWRKQRERNINSASDLRLDYKDLEVSFLPASGSEPYRAQLRFWLAYRSETYSDNTFKELVLVQSPAGWRILSERNLELNIVF